MHFKLQISKLNASSKELRISELSKFYKNEKEKWTLIVKGMFPSCSLEDCEDIFQDSMIKIFEKVSQKENMFNTKERFYGYLKTILRNVGISRFRKYRISTVVLEDKHQHAVEANSIASLEAMETKQRNAILTTSVLKFFKTQKPNYMKVIEMVYFRKMTSRQIAEELPLSLHTIKSYRKDIRTILKTRFGNLVK